MEMIGKYFTNFDFANCKIIEVEDLKFEEKVFF